MGRPGRWLPRDRNALSEWLDDTIRKAEARKPARLHPVVEDFRLMIESDPVMFMYFTQMFQEQSSFQPPKGSGDIKLKNYQQMLVVIDHILTTAPTFDSTKMVGCPINAILDFPMSTLAGLAAFASPKVNEILRRVLIAWGTFLNSADSLYVLNDSPTGWLSPEARKAVHLDEFETDSAAPFLGFKSWNDFFIRRFKTGRRPVACPDDPHAITSPCEATPYALRSHVKEHDAFWIKSQPYSLRHLLHGHLIQPFVGGTVYQAFLSAENYHRWHSPVSGTIKMLEVVPGTYFSEAASEGFDPVGPNNSQGYIAHVAARALLFIEADNHDIGLMCLVLVGMGEVSSCVFSDHDGQPLKEGQRLRKGDQVGYFQFGGSTHCLVFRPGVISQFAIGAVPQGENGLDSALVKVNSLLATVARSQTVEDQNRSGKVH
ncbi:MAG TPA: phosphatidylserine decarboxylase family protein [Pirellulales bacterium]|jgi:phosphatidylserine decarboxylase